MGKILVSTNHSLVGGTIESLYTHLVCETFWRCHFKSIKQSHLFSSDDPATCAVSFKFSLKLQEP